MKSLNIYIPAYFYISDNYDDYVLGFIFSKFDLLFHLIWSENDK